MILRKELEARRFRFGRVDGSNIGDVILQPDGLLKGYKHRNEHSWLIEDGTLIFRDVDGVVTSVFDHCDRRENGYFLSGKFVPKGDEPWHTLTEIVRSEHPSIVTVLRTELYSGDGPFAYANSSYADQGYPHTNLKHDLVESVLDVVRPHFWLELGSMLGGSAIRTADVIKKLAVPTQIVCVDPFTGDVNMWAWERESKVKGAWQFLRLERGKPTIYDRFLANIVAAHHDDIILPIAATSIVGVKLLRRLVNEGRLSRLPDAIYLDSAHEPEETFLELRNCWNLLEPGGVLMGDDWSWDAVRTDVTKFATTVEINLDGVRRLADRHRNFTESNGVLLDGGQWVLAK